MKNIRLVLSCGGARGIAHIGVIEVLEKEGFVITEVAGCSMGAVVGGLYCAGHLNTYKEWLLSLSRWDVFRLLDFTLSSQGFVKGERVFKTVEQMLGDCLIENFNIPFTAIATDLANYKEVQFKSGSLFRALRASIAIPTVFTPVVDNGVVMVDGGVINPLPLNIVAHNTSDRIVAVNVNALSPRTATEAPKNNREDIFYQAMFKKFISQSVKNEDQRIIRQPGFFELLSQSYYLMQDTLTQKLIAMHPPDGLINVSRNIGGVFEFYRASEIIEEGRKATRIMLEENRMT